MTLLVQNTIYKRLFIIYNMMTLLNENTIYKTIDLVLRYEEYYI
jgi:hypothetical protein